MYSKCRKGKLEKKALEMRSNGKEVQVTNSFYEVKIIIWSSEYRFMADA